jgi:sugar lactone lactonase YvrE
MPSASAYTNKLRFVASVKNTKAQLQGGVGNLTQSSIAGCGLDVNYSPIDYLKICPCNVDKPKVPPPPPYIPFIYTLLNEFVSNPSDVAVDSSGNVYILCYNYDIIKVGSTGNIISVITSGYNAESIYIYGDNLYLPSSNVVFILDLNGTLIASISSLFGYAVAMYIDSYQNIYIADYTGNQIVKLNSSGTQQVAFFKNLPNVNGVAVDSLGNVYANYGTNNIAKVTPFISSQFYSPGITIRGMARDSNGNVYVLDNTNNAILKLNSSGILIDTFSTGGAGSISINVDLSGNIYVMVSSGSVINKISPSGELLYSINTIFVTGSYGLAIDSNDYINYLTPSESVVASNIGTEQSIYISGSNNSNISVDISGNKLITNSTTVIYKVSSYTHYSNFSTNSSVNYNYRKIVYNGNNSSMVSMVCLQDYTEIKIFRETGILITTMPTAGLPGSIASIAVTSSRIYASSGDTIYRITYSTVGSTVTWGTWTSTLYSGRNIIAIDFSSIDNASIYAIDSTGRKVLRISIATNTISTQFSIPSGLEPNDISVYSSTIVFVQDTSLNRIVKLTLSGLNAVITNTPYMYQDLIPSGLTRDSTRGSIYVSFQDANIIIVLSVNLSYKGTIYNVVASKGISAYAGSLYANCINSGVNRHIRKITPLTLSSINISGSGQLSTITSDASNNIYVSTDNNQVLKLDVGGTILETISGISSPNGLATNADGTIIYSSNSSAVYKTSSTVTDIATLGGSMNRDSLICDSQNNLYASNGSGNQVFKITPSGTTSIIAGTGVVGYSGDNGIATAAKLNNPAGITLDSSGKNLYIAEYSANSAVRKVVLSL